MKATRSATPGPRLAVEGELPAFVEVKTLISTPPPCTNSSLKCDTKSLAICGAISMEH